MIGDYSCRHLFFKVLFLIRDQFTKSDKKTLQHCERNKS